MHCARAGAQLAKAGRSTSASPPNTASIKRPVLVPVSAHGSVKDRNCALASRFVLDNPSLSGLSLLVHCS